MKKIYSHELKQHLAQKLNYCYILLGEDFFLLKKNQELILSCAYKKGFIETVTVDIEKNKDWETVVLFFKKKNLFHKKDTLVINFLVKILSTTLIKNINQIYSLLNSDILIILKFNHLSSFIQKSKLLHQLKHHSSIISCFTPYDLYFIDWIKYEIREKKINIEDKALVLLCKYYEGDTFFIYKVLSVLLITWPNIYITVDKVKKIIIDFFSFSPLHWLNAILQGQTKKAIYILNFFFKQQYDVLILIRSLQKDLLILIYMKHKKNININAFLEDNNVLHTRCKFFLSGFKKINYNSLFKAIQILVKIEINIKKQYNRSVWNQLKELTLILC